MPNPAELPQSSLSRARPGSSSPDSRVLCAWLGGSFGEGTADRWSDVDFRLVIPDDDFQPFLDTDLELLERISPWLARGRGEPRAARHSASFSLKGRPGRISCT